MTWPGVLVDRLALLLCALIMDAILAWMVFHPVAVGVLQITLVVIAVIWRFQMHHHPTRLRA